MLSDRPAKFVVAKDGSRRMVQWFDTVLRDAQGAVESIAFTGLDVTEQRQAEESRARSLRRLAGVNRLQEDLLLPASLEEKFKKITDAAVELIELDFCRIWRSSRETFATPAASTRRQPRDVTPADATTSAST